MLSNAAVRNDTQWYVMKRKTSHSKSLLRNLLEGMGLVLVLYPEDSYRLPSEAGFSEDIENLRSDARKIASDLRKTTARYHGQIDYR